MWAGKRGVGPQYVEGEALGGGSLAKNQQVEEVEEVPMTTITARGNSESWQKGKTSARQALDKFVEHESASGDEDKVEDLESWGALDEALI